MRHFPLAVGADKRGGFAEQLAKQGGEVTGRGQRGAGGDLGEPLPHRDRRGEPTQHIGIGAFDGGQQGTGRGRERFDKPPPPLCEQRVEGETRLARPADSRDSNQATQRQIEIEALQIADPHSPQRDDGRTCVARLHGSSLRGGRGARGLRGRGAGRRDSGRTPRSCHKRARSARAEGRKERAGSPGQNRGETPVVVQR